MREALRGCLLGLALSDALGAGTEGNVVARGLWKVLGLAKPGILRWTDDTQMALGLVRSLADAGQLDANALARRWAADATWSRGYGPGALKVLRRIQAGMPWQHANRSVFKDGSFGNGAAMRVAPIGVLHDDPEQRRAAARTTALITHAHPLGVEGAVLVAEAAHLARSGTPSIDRLLAVCKEREFSDRIAQIDALLDAAPSPKTVAVQLGNSIRAVESVVTAIYIYFRFREAPYEQMIDFALKVGGDTDTIGAMAGALFGAERGERSLPVDLLARLEHVDVLRDTCERLARQLEA